MRRNDLSLQSQRFAEPDPGSVTAMLRSILRGGAFQGSAFQLRGAHLIINHVLSLVSAFSHSTLWGGKFYILNIHCLKVASFISSKISL